MDQARFKSIANWLGAGVLVLMAVGLIYLTMNDQPTNEPGPPSTQLAATGAPLSPLSVVAASPLPAPLDSPLPAESPLSANPPASFQLTVLHTNDTWGYLFPCG